VPRNMGGRVLITKITGNSTGENQKQNNEFSSEPNAPVREGELMQTRSPQRRDLKGLTLRGKLQTIKIQPPLIPWGGHVSGQARRV